MNAGQILVRVPASSANPIDNGTAAGVLKDMLAHESPITVARDFAGVVEQIGDGVTAVSVADEAFGVVPPAIGGPVHDGTWATQIVSSEQTLTRKPDNLDTAAAGAAGWAGSWR